MSVPGLEAMKIFPNGSSPAPQRRRASDGQSPKVWNKTRTRKIVTPEDISEYEEDQIKLQEYNAAVSKDKSVCLLENIDRLHKEGKIEATVLDVVEFLNEFRTLAQKTTVGISVNKQAYLDLVEQYDLTPFDIVMLAVGTLLRETDAELRRLGKVLLFSASRAGNSHATIRIMNHALLQSHDQPKVFHTSELEGPKAHLRQLASDGQEYRAMVLEGKIAYAMGNVDYAIQLWTDAMEAAVAASDEEKKQRVEGAWRGMWAGWDLTDLSAPWVELQNVHLLRRHYKKAKWAIDIGCEQDDPTSHYAAACSEKELDDNGQHIGTSTWLYHMTKAAASGYVKAMHELGVWYASSGWHYIEDEPPDHVKPTPFDRYPPDSKTTEATSLWSKARSAMGLAPLTQKNFKDNVFHTAAFPSTAHERLQMALQWLDIAMGFLYAPSFLVAARLRLEKTLWAKATAPEDAIELNDNRYEYASKADFEAGKRTQQPGPSIEQDPPNPSYDQEQAKNLVREIFYAQAALETRAKLLRENERARRSKKLGAQSQMSEAPEYEWQMPKETPAEVRKWYRYPEMRQQYMDDKQGILYDDALDINLIVEARKICENQRWDIYAEWDGGLLYRHGMSGRVAGDGGKS
ncbi:hypothetical protein LTR37_017572 [Vermiconidia calcicola]|uniref:Uncharacterized protein n=1 Tax=Vermiconidia calcicola TaxID=1690605 RepID=A0ACC3ML79_9PEZI|nr:hypothetical protein LTR37_017572 [Vermiconidia calcicola]